MDILTFNFALIAKLDFLLWEHRTLFENTVNCKFVFYQSHHLDIIFTENKMNRGKSIYTLLYHYHSLGMKDGSNREAEWKLIVTLQSVEYTHKLWQYLLHMFDLDLCHSLNMGLPAWPQGSLCCYDANNFCHKVQCIFCDTCSWIYKMQFQYFS